MIGIKQHTPEWYEARKGKVTASRFGDLLTLPRSKKDREAGKLSKTTESYMIELITEVLTGESKDLQNIALDWGTEYEPRAREFYELSKLTEVQEVGFVINLELGLVGGSPDGLIGDDGIIEIKCPFNSTNHVEYMLGGDIPKNYYAQIQGNLWLMDRKWCHFISYDERMQKDEHKMVVKHVNRDEDFIKNLEEVIKNFLRLYKHELDIKFKIQI